MNRSPLSSPKMHSSFLLEL